MSATDDLPGSALLRLATPHARPKGHCAWEPNTATIQGRLLIDALEVLERYRNHLPLGPRAIMYQLLPAWVPNHYPDKDKLRSALGDVLSKARRARIIPWESIDDRRTAMAAPWTAEDIPGIYAQMQGDRQAGQPYRIEVWVEADVNLSRIGKICKPYGITVYSGSGSVPITANRQAALRIVDAMDRGQPTLFLIVVDFDPAGIKNIAMALDADVAQFVADYGEDPDEALIVRQVALTEQQALELPAYRREPLKKAPKDWPQDFKVQLEAIDPDVLDALIEDALATVRDEDTLETAMAEEPELKREALAELAREVDG